MTRIDFYSSVADKSLFAAKLLEKVIANEHTVVVYHPDVNALAEFDRYLWSYSEASFLPHCFANEESAQESPIILCHTVDDLPESHHEVLLNLAPSWPPFFSRFERLLEIVGTDDADKTTARERYKFYKDRGYPLNNHNMQGK